MPNLLTALIAGHGAKKLGGGCLSTILIIVILYYALVAAGIIKITNYSIAEMRLAT